MELMDDKEIIRQLEKDLAICRKTVKKMAKKISALKQELGLRKDEIINKSDHVN